MKDWLKNKLAIINYFLYSVIVTVIDTAIVWAFVRFDAASLVVANTIGVVAGFVVHYLLASKSVFQTDYSVAGFIVYLGTFLFGLGFANWLIFVSYHYLFPTYSLDSRILLSKCVSIAIPFFAMYYMRKYLFILVKKKGW